MATEHIRPTKLEPSILRVLYRIQRLLGVSTRGFAGDPAGPPSILTALQEQLGLKLDATRGPVDHLVIESAQRPTEA